ncbi:reverse transcriptase domain-containing protein, partial [Tanacetum coccineum]
SVVAKVSTTTSTSGLSTDVVALTDAFKALLLKNTTPPPTSVKAVEKNYQDNIQAYVSVAAVNYNQGNAGHHPPSVAHQVRPPGVPPVQYNQNRGNNYNPINLTYRAPTPATQAAPSNKLVNYMKVNDTNMRAMQNQITNMKTESKNEFQATMLQQNNKLENMLSNYFQMNKPPSSGPLLSNTVANPKGDLKTITTRSGVSYDGPPIPPLFSSSPKVVEREPEHQLDASLNMKELSLPKLTPTQMILELMDWFTTRPTGIAEDVFVRVGKFYFSTDFVVVDYVVDPRVPLIIRRHVLSTTLALIDVYGEELTLRVSDEAITFKVGNTSRYSYNDAELINRIDVIDIACKEYSQEVLGFSDNSESGNPTPTSEPIIAKSSPSLTPFEGGDFILEEIEACFASDLVPPRIDDAEFDLEGDIRLIKEMLNNDPYSPLPSKDL